MTVICPICKEKLYGFEWKKTQNDANWMQNEMGEWHDCLMNQKHIEPEYTKPTKHDYKKCTLCSRFFLFNQYDDHMREWHPNNELLTDEAFRVIDYEEPKTPGVGALDIDIELFIEKFIAQEGEPNKIQREEIIPKILDGFRKNKYVILQAPTGNGKTSIALALAECVTGCIFLTNTNTTLDAIEKKCVTDNLVTLKGKGQYQCLVLPNLNVSQVSKKICPECDEKPNCEYYQREALAEKKPIVIYNYDKFIADLLFVGKRHVRELLIIDECDLFVNKVREYITIEYSKRTLEKKLKTASAIQFDQENNRTISKVIVWLTKIVNEGNRYIDMYNRHSICINELRGIDHLKKHALSCYKHLKEGMDPEIILLKVKDNAKCNECSTVKTFLENAALFCTKCFECTFDHGYLDITPEEYEIELKKLKNKIGLVERQPDNYVCEFPSGGIKIRPIYVKNTLKNLLQFQNILFISATVNESLFFDEYPLEDNKCGFEKIEKTIIPIENRPIIPAYPQRLSRTTDDITKAFVATVMGEILEKHNKENGIIFDSGGFVRNLLDNFLPKNKTHLKKRFIFPEGSDEPEEIIKLIKNSENKILLISSFGKFARGLNYTDNICRFQIIAKCPFPSLGDEVIKARKKINPEIYNLLTTNTLLQILGRGIRHETDWCKTYILDGHALDKIKNNSPQYIKDSIQNKNPFEMKWVSDEKKIECHACKKEIEGFEYEKHHIQYPVFWEGGYLESIFCMVHKKCHSEIHHTDKYLELRPPEGQSKLFYGND